MKKKNHLFDGFPSAHLFSLLVLDSSLLLLLLLLLLLMLLLLLQPLLCCACVCVVVVDRAAVPILQTLRSRLLFLILV